MTHAPDQIRPVGTAFPSKPVNSGSRKKREKQPTEKENSETLPEKRPAGEDPDTGHSVDRYA